jgi:tRNA-dihydrouridine synthase
MRKHYTNYFRGFENIKIFRAQLVTLDEPAMIFNLLDEIEAKYSHSTPTNVPAAFDEAIAMNY